MNIRIIIALALLPLYCESPFAREGNETVDNTLCNQVANVQFDVNNIFDLTEPDTIFLHQWANLFHITTKPITLINESAFFLKKCDISDIDLLELERHLRKRKYIREATVTRDVSGKVKVETFDNWSMMPTVDFGRKGGINKHAIGVKDRNLLGLGIDAEIEYFSNDQRTGYLFDTQFPLFLLQNITASVRFSSNDDGSAKSAFITKDFVSFDTPFAYVIGFDNFNQIDTQFQNGTEAAQYSHDKSMKTAQWRWLVKDNATETLRYGFGYTKEKHTFNELPDISQILATNGFVPQNREHNYPFIAVEYLQKDYHKFTNFNLINQIEDFNLGWHASVLIGKDFSNTDLSPSFVWRSSLSTGLQKSDAGYLFFDLNFEGELHDDSSSENRYKLSFTTEYFHKFSDTWGGYFKNANVFSQNPFLDQPIAIGDELGVRGYPLQYQRGTRTSQFTLEARYYPHINIYKMFELGGAAFIDSGKAFGDSALPNTNSSVLTSIGFGLRFYSTHSSEAKVIHLRDPLEFVHSISSLPV